MAESATPPHMDAIPLWVSRFLSSCTVVSTVIVLSNTGLQPLLDRYLFPFIKESYLLYSIDIVKPSSPSPVPSQCLLGYESRMHALRSRSDPRGFCVNMRFLSSPEVRVQ